MAPEVVDSAVSDEAGVQGELFQGIKFWLSLRVPQRSRFIDEVKTNGGEVVRLENQADVRIVDHAKKEALPGTYSYTYIEKSVRNGFLEKLEDHVVGPPVGTIRSIGSISHPAKTQRTKFTEEDDRILWKWVHESEQKGGSATGNEIYKQLEMTCSRHTWQSWRDRYVKHLRNHPQTSFAASNARQAATLNQQLIATEPTEPQREIEKVQKAPGFSKDEERALYDRGEDILKIGPDNVKVTWEEQALKIDPDQNHSAGEWQEFWETEIQSKYLAQNPRKAAMTPSSTEKSRSSFPSRSSSFSIKSRSGSMSISAETQQAVSTDDGNPLRIDVSGSEAFESQVAFYPSVEALDRSHRRVNGEIEASEEIRSSPLKRVKGKREFERISSSPPLEPSKRESKAILEIPSSSPPAPMMRKLEAFEETSSSIPLESDYPRKKRRRETLPRPIEIASTPDRSPVRNYIVSSAEITEDENPSTVDEMFKQMRQIEADESSEQESTQEANEAYGRQVSPILSEPTNVASPNEAHSQDLAQSVGLDAPPPNDGWDDQEEKEQALENMVSELQTNVMDTQGVLSGATQVLDLSLPEPDGGWNSDQRPSSPETAESPPTDDIDQSEINARLDAWIDAHVAAGCSADDAILALECTSLDHRLAEEVLEYMTTHQGRIPQERRGVWTEGDDQDLESPDARRILRAGEKHGRKLVVLRWDFLAAYRK